MQSNLRCALCGELLLPSAIHDHEPSGAPVCLPCCVARDVQEGTAAIDAQILSLRSLVEAHPDIGDCAVCGSGHPAWADLDVGSMSMTLVESYLIQLAEQGAGWRSVAPNEIGLYWWRRDGQEAAIVEIDEVDGTLMASFIGLAEERPVSEMHGEWWLARVYPPDA